MLDIGFFIVSFGIAVSMITSLTWKIPGDSEDSDELRNKYTTKEAYLRRAVDDTLGCISVCLDAVNKRVSRVNRCVYTLSASAIMLLIIKLEALND
jgi:hypothetical protein